MDLTNREIEKLVINGEAYNDCSQIVRIHPPSKGKEYRWEFHYPDGRILMASGEVTVVLKVKD